MRTFISYRYPELPMARQLRAALDRRGVETSMITTKLDARGGQLAEELRRHIKGCDCIVVVDSEEHGRSHWVDFELGEGIGKGQFLIVVSSLPEGRGSTPRRTIDRRPGRMNRKTRLGYFRINSATLGVPLISAVITRIIARLRDPQDRVAGIESGIPAGNAGTEDVSLCFWGLSSALDSGAVRAKWMLRGYVSTGLVVSTCFLDGGITEHFLVWVLLAFGFAFAIRLLGERSGTEGSVVARASHYLFALRAGLAEVARARRKRPRQ